jgi:antitoxin HicB
MVSKGKKDTPKQEYANFDDYLRAHAIEGEVNIAVEKQIVAAQMEQERRARKITKKQLANAVGTSRGQLDRVLDPKSQNVTIETLKRVATALGKRLHIELLDS